MKRHLQILLGFLRVLPLVLLHAWRRRHLKSTTGATAFVWDKGRWQRVDPPRS